MLSFKILISKVFGLNHESSLANFTNWLNATSTGIHSICFEFFTNKNLSVATKLTPKVPVDENLKRELNNFFNQNQLNNCQNATKLIAEYLVTFTKHFSEVYFTMHQKTHGLNNSSFSTFLASLKTSSDPSLFKYVKRYKDLVLNKEINSDLNSKSNDENGNDIIEEIKNDAKVSYQHISNELVPLLLMNFNKNDVLAQIIYVIDSDRFKLVNALIQILLVVGSCGSSECQCCLMGEEVKENRWKLIAKCLDYFEA